MIGDNLMRRFRTRTRNVSQAEPTLKGAIRAEVSELLELLKEK
jgi:hypothetical protein